MSFPAEVTRLDDHARVTSGEVEATENGRIILKVHRWITEGSDWCADQHDRMEENQDYLAGDSQWRHGDMEAQEAKGRPSLVMNKVLTMINAVSNREIMQRFEPKVYGRDQNDKGTAKGLDEFMRWQRDRAETEHEESLAFRALCTSGYAIMHKHYDAMADNGEGLICDEEVDPWEMIWDSRARKQNLIDRRWHMRGRWVSRIEAEEEFGDASEEAKKKFQEWELFSRSTNDDETYFHNSSGSGRWPWDSIAAGKWYNRTDDEIFLVEVEWVEAAMEWKAAIPLRLGDYYELLVNPDAQVQLPPDPAAEPDPETGEPPEPPVITGEQFSSLPAEQQTVIADQLLVETEMVVFDKKKDLNEFTQRYFEFTGEDFTDWVKYKRYRFRYAFIAEDVVLDKGDRPEGFTYEFMTGFPRRARDGTRWFGLLDVAKGPQDWRNAFMSLILTRLSQSPKQTLLIEESSVEDLDTFFDQLANPRGAAVVPDGFVSGNRFMTLDPPRFPPMERELLTMVDQEVNSVAGLSGLDTGGQQDLRRVSGTVAQQVKQASNTIIALLFDALRRFRRRYAVLNLRFMAEYYSVEEVRRIIGDEHAEYLDGVENFDEIRRYDIVLDEAETSASERQEFFDFLTRTGTLEAWIDKGLLPFEVVLDWNPWISEADKAKILDYQGNEAEQAKEAKEAAQSELEALKKSLANAGPDAQQALLRHDAQQAAEKPPPEGGKEG